MGQGAERFSNDDLPAFGEAPEIRGDVGESAVSGSAHPSSSEPEHLPEEPAYGVPEQLCDDLIGLRTELGMTPCTSTMRKRTDAGDVDWLKDQIATARKHVAEREQDVDTQESFFQQRAAEVQEKQAARRKRP